MKRKARPAVPKTIMAASIFKPFYTLLKDLDSGEVNSAEDGTVLIDKFTWAKYVDDHFNAATTLDIWCDNWERIAEVAKIPSVKTDSLRYLSTVLNNDVVELNESTIKSAKAELDEQYKLWIKLPLPVLQKAVLTD